MVHPIIKYLGFGALGVLAAGVTFGAFYESERRPTNVYYIDVDNDKDKDLFVGFSDKSVELYLSNGVRFKDAEGLLQKALEEEKGVLDKAKQKTSDEYHEKLKEIDRSLEETRKALRK